MKISTARQQQALITGLLIGLGCRTNAYQSITCSICGETDIPDLYDDPEYPEYCGWDARDKPVCSRCWENGGGARSKYDNDDEEGGDE